MNILDRKETAGRSRVESVSQVEQTLCQRNGRRRRTCRAGSDASFGLRGQERKIIRRRSRLRRVLRHPAGVLDVLAHLAAGCLRSCCTSVATSAAADILRAAEPHQCPTSSLVQQMLRRPPRPPSVTLFALGGPFSQMQPQCSQCMLARGFRPYQRANCGITCSRLYEASRGEMGKLPATHLSHAKDLRICQYS